MAERAGLCTQREALVAKVVFYTVSTPLSQRLPFSRLLTEVWQNLFLGLADRLKPCFIFNSLQCRRGQPGETLFIESWANILIRTPPSSQLLSWVSIPLLGFHIHPGVAGGGVQEWKKALDSREVWGSKDRLPTRVLLPTEKGSQLMIVS